MRAEPLMQRRGLLAALAARAEAWLLEPPEHASAPEGVDEEPVRPVVAVAGLGPRCGTTTVARGLAAVLAAADPARAAVVTAERLPAASMLRTPAAARLARELAEAGMEPARAVGRLCLLPARDAHPAAAMARALAPVVLDVPTGGPLAEMARLADRVLLVTGPGIEPALAHVAAEALARFGPAPLVVVNRYGPGGGELPAQAFALPAMRLAAQVAFAGREPPGAFGEALAELAAACGAARAR